MAIIDSELKIYKSAVVNDTSTNGGYMSANQVVSGVANNVFPNVFKADRIAGITTYRKVFCKVANDADETLYNPQIWLDILTPGDDWVVFFAGTQTDTQGTWPTGDTATKYGCGALRTNVSASATTLEVNVEDTSLESGTDVIFRSGDTIRITNKATISSPTGTEEEHEVNTVVDSGTYLTITLVGGGLANAYTVAEGTRVMSVYEPADVEASFSSFVDTTAGTGTYDNEATNLTLDNIGTVQEAWTITIQSDTDLVTISGSNLGTVATDVDRTAGDVAPSNPDFSKPYFTLADVGWSDYGTWTGEWAQNDTITFTTVPAAVPIWEKRVVPAGSTSLTGDKTTLVFSGESV